MTKSDTGADSEKVRSGKRPELYQRLNPKETQRICDVISKIFNSTNRYHVFEYLREGSTREEMERGLTREPYCICDSSAIDRALNFYEKNGIGVNIQTNQGRNKWVLTDCGATIARNVKKAEEGVKPIEMLDIELDNFSKNFSDDGLVGDFIGNLENIRDSGEELVKVQGEHKVTNKYQGVIRQRAGKEVDEIKEISADLVSYGIPEVHTPYYKPVTELGLDLRLIQTQQFVDEIRDYSPWRDQAAEHQAHGVNHRSLPSDVPFTTLTLFGDEYVGMVVETDDYYYYESGEQTVIEYYNNLFEKCWEVSEEVQYESTNGSQAASG